MSAKSPNSLNTDGSNQTLLTDPSISATDASWSSDGSKIVFAYHSGGRWDLWTMNPDGSNKVRVTNDTAVEYHPEFSPDGTKICYRGNATGSYNIWVLTLATGQAVDLAPSASICGAHER